MSKRLFLIATLLIVSLPVWAQINQALAMSESLAYTARFNETDRRQLEIIKKLSPAFLVQNLKTDNQKNAFWLNVYNSLMLIKLKDTLNEGMYTRFYKIKNITIAGKVLSLFDIEHEFLLAGKKMKSKGFRKSRLDTTWIKLRPSAINPKVVFCMYHGLYGYAPFQSVENGDIDQAFANIKPTFQVIKGNSIIIYDWIKPYKKLIPNIESIIIDSYSPVYQTAPLAVYIKNFYPKYEGVKFKEEEINPWLKK
jgi:hypothetical protein